MGKTARGSVLSCRPHSPFGVPPGRFCFSWRQTLFRFLFVRFFLATRRTLGQEDVTGCTPYANQVSGLMGTSYSQSGKVVNPAARSECSAGCCRKAVGENRCVEPCLRLTVWSKAFSTRGDCYTFLRRKAGTRVIDVMEAEPESTAHAPSWVSQGRSLHTTSIVVPTKKTPDKLWFGAILRLREAKDENGMKTAIEFLFIALDDNGTTGQRTL